MTSRLKTGVLCAAVLALCSAAHAQTSYPFLNPRLPADARIDNILSLMTVQEKINALSTNSGVERLGIPSFGGTEGIHGVVQRGGRNSPSTPTTQFVQPPGMGASWNPELVRQAAAVQSTEARWLTQSDAHKRPMLMQWGPQADLARDPRWGRLEEVYSEDPFLAGTMSVAFTKGLQGDHPTYWRGAALLKHFLANSNENGRGNSSSNFDERLFWEYYAVPFKMSFEEAGARGVMAAYNAWNGIPMGVHPILNSVVIDQWGVDVVSSDGGAVGNLVKLYKRYPNQQEAVVVSLRAGINQFLDKYKDELAQAIKDGAVSEAELDKALRRKFRVTLRLGLIDPPDANPYAAIKNGPQPWLSEAHKAVSLKLALESVVLLKNANNTLPLAKARLKSIAVIGPHADTVHWDWYGGHPPYKVTALDGIRAAVGGDVNVNYVADNRDGLAVKAARESDVAIVLVGNHPTCGPNMGQEWTDAGTKPCADPGDGREGRDRETLALAQEELVRQIYGANRRTVMVLVSSFPFTINWSAQNVPAIVHMAHSSQDQGTALAKVLFGDYNPGGKLVSTWPASMDQLPPMMEYDIRRGHTYMYFRGKPLFPFGHGLSYTSFKYAKLRTSAARIGANGKVNVSVDVTNTGARAGDSVVQLYASWPKSKLERPGKALVGFARVPLRPGETRTVQIPLKANQLAYWNTGKGAFELEKAPVRLMVGSSSADIKLGTTLDVD
jgi:beta-glucosidase